jgi:hypothetical protein
MATSTLLDQLICAVIHYEDYEQVCELLALGADPNGVNAHGMSVLEMSLCICSYGMVCGSHHLIKALLDAGADPNTRFCAPYWRRSKQHTYLVDYVAHQKYGFELLSLFVKHGANPHHIASEGLGAHTRWFVENRKFDTRRDLVQNALRAQHMLSSYLPPDLTRRIFTEATDGVVDAATLAKRPAYPGGGSGIKVLNKGRMAA